MLLFKFLFFCKVNFTRCIILQTFNKVVWTILSAEEYVLLSLPHLCPLSLSRVISWIGKVQNPWGLP